MAREDLLVAAAVSDCWVLFSSTQSAELFFPQLEVCVYLLDFSLSPVKLPIFIIALFTSVQSTKAFPLILSQGKIANLFWHAI